MSRGENDGAGGLPVPSDQELDRWLARWLLATERRDRDRGLRERVSFEAWRPSRELSAALTLLQHMEWQGYRYVGMRSVGSGDAVRYEAGFRGPQGTLRATGGDRLKALSRAAFLALARSRGLEPATDPDGTGDDAGDGSAAGAEGGPGRGGRAGG